MLTALEHLAELESGWADAARGQTLLHADLRADNLLLTDDQVMVIDWPYAVTGVAWVDVLLFLPSVTALRAHQREKGIAALHWLRSRIS